ncbi:hypothetical protein JCM19275_150 [Nonlabens ulvanivorans]|uniref:Uncharacterized protein n=1 Tax=Nonlabens ulvanivorans TaxID=906888 RepID=A0A090WG31_NONUL|nr:hypothetical protein JCM19275_150 [Nonlabens ulvanivorans]
MQFTTSIVVLFKYGNLISLWRSLRAVAIPPNPDPIIMAVAFI